MIHISVKVTNREREDAASLEFHLLVVAADEEVLERLTPSDYPPLPLDVSRGRRHPLSV
jgi:hypothetical protein